MTDLRDIVTPDPDGDATGPNYGPKFLETDYAAVPHRDLPFGVPPWFGDDAWGALVSCIDEVEGSGGAVHPASKPTAASHPFTA